MWRNSKLFIYGYLPIRIIAATIALLAGAVVYGAALIMWLDSDYAEKTTKGIFG